VDNALLFLAKTRQNWVQALHGAGSGVDEDVQFHSSAAVLQYLPRAAQIALLAPFPDMWFGRATSPGGRIKRLVSMGEMLVAYVAYVALLWQLIYRLKPVLLSLVVFAVTPMIIMTYVQVYVGGLYRYRYPFWLLLVGMGLVSLLALARHVLSGMPSRPHDSRLPPR
jgi:hypothetical protein